MAGAEASFCKVDVSQEDSVKAGFEHAIATYSRCDVVVNCAGIVGPTKIKTAEIDTADFDRVYNVNLRGSFLVTKYAIPHMLKNDYGRILLIASIAGKEGNAGMAAYSMSKAGVIGFVKAAGKEYAETNITINGLAPAVVRTQMVANMEPEQVKYMTDKIPMKRCTLACALFCGLLLPCYPIVRPRGVAGSLRRASTCRSSLHANVLLAIDGVKQPLQAAPSKRWRPLPLSSPAKRPLSTPVIASTSPVAGPSTEHPRHGQQILSPNPDKAHTLTRGWHTVTAH